MGYPSYIKDTAKLDAEYSTVSFLRLMRNDNVEFTRLESPLASEADVKRSHHTGDGRSSSKDDGKNNENVTKHSV